MTGIVSGGALNSTHSFVFSGATLPLKVVVTSSVARMWRQGRQDDGGAEGALPSAKRRVGWRMGRGVTSPADYGIWGSVVSSLRGVRTHARLLSHILHVLGHRTLLVARKIRFSCPKYKEKIANSTFQSGW